MPEGQDPDDLLRAKGASAVQSIVDTAMPLVELLWRRETIREPCFLSVSIMSVF